MTPGRVAVPDCLICRLATDRLAFGPRLVHFVAEESLGTAVAQPRGMSLLRAPLMSAALVLGLACAPTPKNVEPPQCDEPEPTVVVSNPMVSPPTVVVPREPELVSLRLFVVSASGEGIDEDLPDMIRSSPTCASSGCTLLLSPMLLGRSRGEMALEVGTDTDQNMFSLEAKPFLSKDHVELELRARFAVETEGERVPRHELKFEGLLEPGQLTHVGTFHAEDRRGHTVGPQLFVMVESATEEG